MDANSIVANVAATLLCSLASMIGAQFVAYLRKHLGAKNLAVATEIARGSVAAVEQVAATRGWDSLTKREDALRRVRAFAAASGVRFSDQQWQSLIEAAVAEMKQLGRELDPPAPAT